MVYYGMRSSRYYLHQLAECRMDPQPHHIVSVAGGGAFLHSLGPTAKSLTIVDTDDETIDFNRQLVRWIRSTAALKDFRRFIRSRFPDKDGKEGDGPPRKIVLDAIGSESKSLEKGVFYWEFGQHNFACQESYDMLRTILANVPTKFIKQDLKSFDYSPFGLKTYVFISNADGQQYHSGDEILRKVVLDARRTVVYVSWLRRVTVEPNIFNASYTGYSDV